MAYDKKYLEFEVSTSHSVVNGLEYEIEACMKAQKLSAAQPQVVKSFEKDLVMLRAALIYFKARELFWEKEYAKQMN